MGSLNRNFRTGLMSSIAAAIGTAFGKIKSNIPTFAPPTKRMRHFRNCGMQNPAGSKIRRAIARGNFGVVNKHGTIGRAVAEMVREKWLKDHGKPVIRLSTSF